MNKIQPSGVGSKSTQIHQYAQFNMTTQIWPISVFSRVSDFLQQLYE